MTSSSFAPATTAARSPRTVSRCHPARPSTYASGLAAGIDFFIAEMTQRRNLSGLKQGHRHSDGARATLEHEWKLPPPRSAVSRLKTDRSTSSFRPALRAPARQLRRLPDPAGQKFLVEPLVL